MNIRQHDAGLRDDDVVGGIDRPHPVHALEGHQHRQRPRPGDLPAHQPGPAGIGHDPDPGGRAKPHRLRDRLGFRRSQHRRRPTRQPPPRLLEIARRHLDHATRPEGPLELSEEIRTRIQKPAHVASVRPRRSPRRLA